MRTGLGDTPLHEASSKGNAEIVQTLIDAGADVNAEDLIGSRPIETASLYGHAKVVKILEEAGGTYPIEVLTQQLQLEMMTGGDISTIQSLIDAGADVNVPHKLWGTHPLQNAASYGKVEVVRLLIDSEANVNSMDTNDITPLHSAMEFGSVEIVRLLIDNGADVNAQDFELDSPLHWAVMRPIHPTRKDAYIKVVRILLDNGADVNALNDSGFTPLDLAEEHQHVEIAQMLIDAGAVE